MTLSHAQIEIVDNTPKSTVFGDTYFYPENGREESHYNFISGNDLEDRFANNTASQFTIAETGFGTGLNFIITAELWQHSQKNTQQRKLHYISTEKYPLTKSDFSQIIRQYTDETTLINELIDAYPEHPATGPYDIQFSSHAITLTLLFGESSEQLKNYAFSADAWYLDGFAPSKNPDMWSTQLFSAIAEKSHDTTTFATFTAASAVRKGLIEAGFTVTKESGFGNKRERLLGSYAPPKK